MGQSLELACIDCKDSIVIGKHRYIFKDDESSGEIRDFLINHYEHNLRLLDDYNHQDLLDECELST